MPIIVHHENITGTASSGTFSVNTGNLRFGILREVIVKPVSEATIYDVSLTNDKSLINFQRKSQTGSIGIEVALPVRGIYTFKIESASADEVFTAQLVLEE